MPQPTIVLVHGAWADGSSWNAVAAALRGQGFPVFTPPNLLRRASVDAPYIASFVAQRTSGPSCWSAIPTVASSSPTPPPVATAVR